VLSNKLWVNAPGRQVDPYEHEKMRENIKKCRSGDEKKVHLLVSMCVVYEMFMYELGESRLIVDRSLDITWLLTVDQGVREQTQMKP